MNRVIDIGLVAVTFLLTFMDSQDNFLELVRPGEDGAKDDVVTRNGYIVF